MQIIGLHLQILVDIEYSRYAIGSGESRSGAKLE